MKLHISYFFGLFLLFINVINAIKCTNLECLDSNNVDEIIEVYVFLRSTISYT